MQQNPVDSGIAFLTRMIVLITLIIAALVAINWSVATVKAGPSDVARWMDSIIGIGQMMALGFMLLGYVLIGAMVAGLVVFLVWKFRQQHIELLRVQQQSARAIGGGGYRELVDSYSRDDPEGRIMPMDTWRPQPSSVYGSRPTYEEDQ